MFDTYSSNGLMNELSCRMVIVFAWASAGPGRLTAAVAPAAASLRNVRRDVALECAGLALLVSLLGEGRPIAFSAVSMRGKVSLDAPPFVSGAGSVTVPFAVEVNPIP